MLCHSAHAAASPFVYRLLYHSESTPMTRIPSVQPRSRHLLLPLVVILLSHRAPTQAPRTPTVPTPTYDVVSITPNKSDSGNMMFNNQDATFTATNMRLKNLLSNAFDIREDLISGLPNWAGSARYDLKAKIVDPDLPALKKLTENQRADMLAQVLADRFQLKSHTETKNLPVYNLVVTPHGPKFKPSPNQDDQHGGMSGGDHEVTINASPIATLVYFLAGDLHRTVIDQTGLTARYDLHLTWAPDTPDRPAGQDNGQPADAGPSLFSALVDQLGLKLVPAKGPVPTLVIDHIDPPTPN